MEKLKKTRDFNRVYNKGKKKSGKYLLLFENKSKEQKFGIVASKKTGNSVYRSRAKRLIRESIRNNIDLFSLEKEYIFVMKSIFKDRMKDIKCQDIEKDIRYIMKKSYKWKKLQYS